jgi:hypothetical protein
MEDLHYMMLELEEEEEIVVGRKLNFFTMNLNLN